MPGSVAQRLVALAVVLILTVGIAVVALQAGTAPIGGGVQSPSASASAQPSPDANATEEPEASPDSSQLTDDEAMAILTEIEEQVRAIRGLDAPGIGPPDIITREELIAELEAIFDEEYPHEERERDNQALRALGLLTPEQDVAELQLELLGEQVLGFYDDIDKRMVVVADEGLDAEAKLTYAHEYTHALQDAAFTLDTLETDAVGEDDRGLARTALIEGDATLTMIAWMVEHLSREEQLELGQTPMPELGDTPSWMIQQLQFPYGAGQAWAAELALGSGGDPTSPDYAEIDAAFADPPDSTEQIIHILKWLAREEPIPVEVPDLAATLGEGWQKVDTSPIGQASITIMLEYLGVPPAQAFAAGEGWGGDRAVIATGPDDAFALAWRLAWDAPVHAAEFADAYAIVVENLPFPASMTELPNGEVLVVHGSSQEIHDATLAAAR